MIAYKTPKSPAHFRGYDKDTRLYSNNEPGHLRVSERGATEGSHDTAGHGNVSPITQLFHLNVVVLGLCGK